MKIAFPFVAILLTLALVTIGCGQKSSKKNSAQGEMAKAKKLEREAHQLKSEFMKSKNKGKGQEAIEKFRQAQKIYEELMKGKKEKKNLEGRISEIQQHIHDIQKSSTWK